MHLLNLTWYFLIEWADLDFLFHMFFLARYCKLLEENSFRGRTADFFYMLLFGATVLTGIVLLGGMIPYLSESFAKIIFLSNSLTFMMVSHIFIYLYFSLLVRSNSTSKASSWCENCLPIIYSILIIFLTDVRLEFFLIHLLKYNTFGLGVWMIWWMTHLMNQDRF